jgi:hypothetical protein
LSESFWEVNVSTDAISQGARTAVGAFFVYGAKELAPPPPLDTDRFLIAACLVMMALVLWVIVEWVENYFQLDTTRKRKPKKTNSAWRNMGWQVFSLFGLAPDNRGGSGSSQKRRKGL